jgi:hypothetical protein
MYDRLGPLAYTNPSLLLAKGRELAGIDGEPSEPQGGVEAEAKDFMRVLCPKCKCEVNIRL